MKKILSLAATALLASSLLFAGCGSNESAAPVNTDQTVIKVGATPVPHSEILEQIKPILEKDGVKLEIMEFSDYVQPNIALNDGEIDANFYQHEPYLDSFNKERGTKLQAICKVHLEPMGLYSSKIDDIKGLKNGSRIAIPNDPTNGGRALLLLQNHGIIELKDGGSTASTISDIVKNPNHLTFIELDAAQLPRSLSDVDAAVINTNYALQANLNPLTDALIIETKDSPYANILVIREGTENNEKIQKLVKALHSPEARSFIANEYKGAIVPAF